MKKIIGSTLLTACLIMSACGSNESNEKITTDTTAAMSSEKTAATFTVAMVDNKKDPTCGMPVTAGISDTAHYDNHVLGFCSSECKAEFLKNPKAGLAAAELAK